MSSLAPPSSAPTTSASSTSAPPSSSTKDAFEAALKSRDPKNNYIAHLKIWETPDESEKATGPAAQPKARYLILAVQRDTGRVTLNKAKRNANGSYSVGKDWDVNALRAVEVIDANNFALSLSRTYRWQTEHGREQTLFLTSLVRVFRKYTGDSEGLTPRLIGIEVSNSSTTSAATSSNSTSTSTSSTNTNLTNSSRELKERSAIPTSSSGGRDKSVERDRSRRPTLGRSNTSTSTSSSRNVGVSPQLDGSPVPTAFTSAGANGDAAKDGFYDPRGGRRPSAPTLAAPTFSRTASNSSNAGSKSSLESQRNPKRQDSAPTQVTGSTPNESQKDNSKVIPTLNLPEEEIETLSRSASRAGSRSGRSRSGSTSSNSNVDRSTSRTPEPALSRSMTSSPSPSKRGNASKSSENGGTPFASAHATPTHSPTKKTTPLPSSSAANPSSVSTSKTKTSTSSESSLSAIPSVDKASSSISRPSKQRSGSSSSSINSLRNQGGLTTPTVDARARLSAVEPVRGGAAYEKMLLAGTGLMGLDEDDEDDEDPYGGTTGGESMSNGIGEDEKKKKEARGSPTGGTGGEKARARTKEAALEAVSRNGGGGSSTSINGVLAAGDGSELLEGEEDTTLLNVEEMLEGFEWRNANTGNTTIDPSSGGIIALRGKGTADVIEARLLDELAALEAANIHAIIESDDRVNLVVGHMDEALLQLDVMDSMLHAFKAQLNARADDISHIESQNRGLQVQTSNQRTLITEIENLLDTIHVDEEVLEALHHAPLDNDEGISLLENAAAALYKSVLQAKRDDDMDGRAANDPGGNPEMAATTERLEEYTFHSTQFCKRLLEFLEKTFQDQVHILLTDPQRMQSLSSSRPNVKELEHSSMEDALGKYCGLLLFMKEIDPTIFSRVSAAYFASASEAYKKEMLRMFANSKDGIKNVSEEDSFEASFTNMNSGVGGSGATSGAAAALRSGTIRRPNKDKKKITDKGEIKGSEAFQRLLTTIIPLVSREQSFISDLLHINDNAVTFADYMDLEPYFRRRAAAVFGSGAPGAVASRRAAGPLREMKGALDLIFGFLPPEWQAFTDHALQKDPVQVIGILAALDRAIVEAEELSNDFLLRSLSKLHMRLVSHLERFVSEQITGIEQTKLTIKKRKGIVPFIKVFPVFVDRVEAQLLNAETLNIRQAIDGYYERISRTMFDALQAMAKMSSGGPSAGAGGAGGDEDKGQLNHHVILIENMHHFISALTSPSRARTAALAPLVRRAEAIYGDSLAAYVHFVLRRPLGKMMDFADGIDALLKSTPPNEVQLHSAYSKSSLKKLLKEYSAKDMRKAVEALSKRVGKHFDDDDPSSSSIGVDADEAAEVLSRVWKSCEESFERETERLTRIIRDCYADGNNSLEFNSADVARAFQNTRR